MLKIYVGVLYSLSTQPIPINVPVACFYIKPYENTLNMYFKYKYIKRNDFENFIESTHSLAKKGNKSVLNFYKLTVSKFF